MTAASRHSRHRSRDPARRDLRPARPQRGRQDHPDQRDLRTGQCQWRHGSGGWPRQCPCLSRGTFAHRLVPQELTGEAFSTVWDTVSFSRGLFGKPASPSHIEKILRSLSLWEKRRNKLITLSGGMKRRVLIAKRWPTSHRFSFSTSPPPASMSSCAATCGTSCAACARMA